MNIFQKVRNIWHNEEFDVEILDEIKKKIQILGTSIETEIFQMFLHIF